MAFSLTATAQTQTRETAGANNEIIRRGGARARVFEAKPSPFFDIFLGFGEKAGEGGVCSDGFRRKRLKLREPKICKKRFENLAMKRILFNTTF